MDNTKYFKYILEYYVEIIAEINLKYPENILEIHLLT